MSSEYNKWITLRDLGIALYMIPLAILSIFVPVASWKLAWGMGFLLVLVTLGTLREVIGAGTLFANAHLMFGEGARSMLLTLGDDYPGFLLAVLPPGAFIGLGLLIAIKNHIDRRSVSSQAVIAETPAETPAG